MLVPKLLKFLDFFCVLQKSHFGVYGQYMAIALEIKYLHKNQKKLLLSQVSLEIMPHLSRLMTPIKPFFSSSFYIINCFKALPMLTHTYTYVDTMRERDRATGSLKVGQ